MNSCTNCGQSLRPGARFCGACGTPQTPEAEPPTERLPRKPSSDPSQPPEIASDQKGFLLVAGVGVLVLLLLGYGLWWMLSPSSEVVEGALGTATVLISTAVPEAEEAESPSPNVPTTTSSAPSTPTTTASTPAASAIFSDDFSDSESGLPHQASGEGWSSAYEDGMYVMTAEFFPFGSSWERYDGLDFDDFTLNVEAERLDGVPSDYYGVIFRAQDDHNYNLFQLSELGLARWQRVVDGETESLIEAKIITVNSNKANKITIEAQGQQLTVSVNGEEVHTIDDDPIGHGSIGFIVTNQGLPFTAGFDNLSVTR